MISGRCHCGAVRITVPAAPATVTNCNCSICRRLGALWGYYDAASVTIQGHPEHTQDYVQGDRTLRVVRCATCGCTTHWEPLQRGAKARRGVNMRNFEPALVQGARLLLLDGATTWTCLPAEDLVAPRRRVNRAWHAAMPMPARATEAQRVDWHRAHALACGCRATPARIVELIAAQTAA